MFDKVRKGRHHNSRKTMCKWGHTFTDKNTYVCKDGSRKCIRCRNKRNSERKRLRG